MVWFAPNAFRQVPLCGEDEVSDWLTHVGAAYGPGRLFLPGRLRLVLIGGILPDIGTPLVVLANLLHLHPGAVESYLQPMQAPIPTFMLAAAIALLTVGRRRSFAALLLGVAIHYALDLSQVRYGGGIYLFYPLNFDSPSFDLYWPESVTNLVLLGLGVVGVAWAMVRPGPRIAWTRRNIRLALFAVALALALPLFTLGAFRAANANNVAFYADPSAWEGRSLALAKVEVETVEPAAPGWRVTIRKGERRVAIRAASFERWGASDAAAPTPRERISVRGTYRDGALHAEEEVHVHFRPLRTWTSLAALLLLATLLVLPPERRAAQRADFDR
jgi:hypothetical protein